MMANNMDDTHRCSSGDELLAKDGDNQARLALVVVIDTL